MLELIGPLITAIKNAGPPIYAAALAATLFLFLLPHSVITELGILAEFKKFISRLELGLTLIASASLLVTHALFAAAPFISNRWRTWRLHRDAHNTLSELTNAEKVFLRKFIVDGENTQYASIYDGVANGLVGKGLVYRASEVSVPGSLMKFPFNLQPYARKILSNNRHLID